MIRRARVTAVLGNMVVVVVERDILMVGQGERESEGRGGEDGRDILR